MFRNSLLAFLALSTSALLGCGDNYDPAGPPVLAAPHIYVATTQGSAVEIDASATDEGGRKLTYAAAPPSHGSVSGTGPKFTYTPADGFFGDDELTITISNGGVSVTVTVTITVAAHDAVPVTMDGTIYVARNGTTAINLTATDSDSPSLTYTVVATPEHGTLSGTAPDLIYTPDADYDGADTITYEASDGLATSNVSTLTIDVTVCGDGSKTPNEQCDDGNLSDQDGCDGSCQREYCGDGVIQLGLDEQCDDGNMLDGDGCSSGCVAEPATTMAPVMVSGALTGCTTEPANAGTKVAADTADVYGVFRCGDNGYVVVSHDHGATYSAPTPLIDLVPGPSPTIVDHVAVSVGIAGVAYVAYVLDDGEVYLRRSRDHGATWGAAALIGSTSRTDGGVSLGSFNHFVYLAFATGGQPAHVPQPVNNAITVFTNHQDGNGAFDPQVLSTPDFNNFDVLYDPTINVLALAVDNVSFTVRVSSNQSETWSPAIPASGMQDTGDWALGGAHLYVAGIDSGAASSSGTLFYYTPQLSQTPEVGLPLVTTLRSRSLAADMLGDAFVASQLDAGGIQLDRYMPADNGFDFSRSINATGTHPSVTNLRSYTGAVVIYTDGDQAWIGVQAYGQSYTCPPHAPC